MAKYLDRVHPRFGKGKPITRGFKKLKGLYRSLDREGDLICFCSNYFAACLIRTPAAGKPYRGYSEEVDFLEELTFARNDRIKFDAINCYGRFAPIDRIAFCVKRAARRLEGCRNPNIVLCNTMSAIGAMADRFQGVSDRRTALERKTILATLPALVEVLDTEGRNNGACGRAGRSIEIIIDRTGAPEALRAYIHSFKAPRCDSPFMIDHTARYHEKALQWIRVCTGQEFGVDFDAWTGWFRKKGGSLFYDRKKKKFVVNAAAAKAFEKICR